jgi:hypothetical protein
VRETPEKSGQDDEEVAFAVIPTPVTEDSSRTAGRKGRIDAARDDAGRIWALDQSEGFDLIGIVA